MTIQPVHSEKRQPKLLDRVREALRVRHMSPRTEKAYLHWIRRYILFHRKRHPAEMGEREINAFLTDLAVRQNVSASSCSSGRWGSSKGSSDRGGAASFPWS
jgi:hypothetical protein